MTTENRHYRYLEFNFDQGRLDRSKDIIVSSVDEDGMIMGDGEYLAIGGGPHYLTLRPSIDCDCNDFAWGPNRLCKHLIAALTLEGNEILEACIASAKTRPTITLVAGPPGAGKNYYVGQQAKTGDIVWDYDSMSAAITFQSTGKGRSVTKKDMVRAIRDAFMRKLKDMYDNGTLADDVWIIWTMPSAKARAKLSSALDAKVVVIETSASDCMSRGRREENITHWWTEYERRDGETII